MVQMIVLPWSASCCNAVTRLSAMNESRPEVGSSANNNGGSVITWLVMTYSELVWQQKIEMGWNKKKKNCKLFVYSGRALSCAKLNTLKTLNLNTLLIRNTELIQTQHKNEAVDWLLKSKHSRTELNSGVERNKFNNFLGRDTNKELSRADQSATLPPRWKTGNSGYHNITLLKGKCPFLIKWWPRQHIMTHKKKEQVDVGCVPA